ncbi:MAG: adenylyltransferase/cytidyltransferase family protein [Candidatus Sungbacteria bacterium]|nr:adenylyltransferase/cytidyltransferase family protein [Candidatus Sungbacteria bacterium]
MRVKSAKKPIVVAVSGGFDPLHYGHVRMMQEVKKLGDELVVIINNDNWLKKKKGYVFMPQNERREVIEALACVDRVVFTSHPKNPKDMSVGRDLRRMRPDIFAQGGDRKIGNAISSEVKAMKSTGGKIVYNLGRGGKVQSSSLLVDKAAEMKSSLI